MGKVDGVGWDGVGGRVGGGGAGRSSRSLEEYVTKHFLGSQD